MSVEIHSKCLGFLLFLPLSLFSDLVRYSHLRPPPALSPGPPPPLALHWAPARSLAHPQKGCGDDAAH